MRRAHLHIVLGAALAARGADAEAADHALNGAHRADDGDASDQLGAWSRLVLGGALLRQGRAAESATVLETALPDLVRAHHDGRSSRPAGGWARPCATGTSRAPPPSGPAAAEIAQGWEEQQDRAVLANLAAGSRERAGLAGEAAQACTRAGELWRALERPVLLVPALRARARLSLHDDRAGLEAGRSAMAEAAAVAEEAPAAARAFGEEAAAAHLRAELAGTHKQTGELIVRACPGEPGEDDADGSARAAYEEGLASPQCAIAAFDPGPARSAVRLTAAWLEADPGRRAAAERARAVIARYTESREDGEDEVAAQRLTEARFVLAYAGERAAGPREAQVGEVGRSGGVLRPRRTGTGRVSLNGGFSSRHVRRPP
ncbi:hypothetical protein [Actinacidiphila sp. bgisy167]|uniref:hypothetical protein n=1 Tax=Actinacidiphila sp. bgisy167 TaxID=3413797 RepID=UPI003D720988